MLTSHPTSFDKKTKILYYNKFIYLLLVKRRGILKTSPFGDYLRSLREGQVPKVTQEQLADAVGKKKMTISQIETGTNAPPQGEFLEKIISALHLSRSEEITLRDLSALARGTIPSDMLQYFTETQGLRDAIRRAMDHNYSNTDWDEMIK